MVNQDEVLIFITRGRRHLQVKEFATDLDVLNVFFLGGGGLGNIIVFSELPLMANKS